VSWEAIKAAKDARVRAEAHALLCSTAKRLMPHLSADDAREMRIAMFAGPGRGLRELVRKHWVAA